MKKNAVHIFILLLLISWLSAKSYRVVGRAPEKMRGPEVEFSKPNIDARNSWFNDDALKREYSIPQESLTEPIEIRLCVLRVQFQEDSNTRSTGNGQFDLSPDSLSEIYAQDFDPTPHNWRYFNDHMQALHNYWMLVSDSLIDIKWDIYPIRGSGTEAYTLPDSMAYYGPNGWCGNALDERMDAFIVDAVRLAQQTDHMDFTRYDDVIIFHAGSDWQNDIGSLIDPAYLDLYPEIEPSPDDLPTGYKKLFREIVPGVTGALIMPESGSQDGQITLLNGVLVHESSHLLGLIDLYNTSNFVSEVGHFSVMDNGHAIGVQIAVEDSDSAEYYNVYGAIPVYPCAWERAFLGIEDVITAWEDDEYAVTACELFEAGTTIVKIPINEFEYYLVENRNTNPDGKPFALKADSISGVILGLQDTLDNFVAKYDFLLPGSGMLIWHIDELVAYSNDNFANNALQWNHDRLFVDLIEADGFQDMGFYRDYGDSSDIFFDPNNTEFTPHTKPKTESNARGNTSIYITDISEIDSRMSFNFERRMGVNLWKRQTGLSHDYSPIVIDADGDGSMDIFSIPSSANFVTAWNFSGEELIPGSDSLVFLDFSDDTLVYHIPVFSVMDTSFFSVNISAGDIDGDSDVEIIGGSETGMLYAWHSEDLDSSERADPVSGFPVALHSAIAYPPLLYDLTNEYPGDEILALTDDEIFYIINSSGDSIVTGTSRGENIAALAFDGNYYILAERDYGRIRGYSYPDSNFLDIILDIGNISGFSAGDINRDGIIDFIITSEDGYVSVWSENGEKMEGFPYEFADSIISRPAICDINQDGYGEIIFCSKTKVYNILHSGISATNFPAIARDYDYALYAEPTCADIDGDNECEIVITGFDGNIYAFENDGTLLPDYPLAGGFNQSFSPICDMDGDSKPEMVIGSSGGSVMLFRFPETTKEPEWTVAPSGNRIWNHMNAIDPIYGDKAGEIINPYIWPNPGGSKVHFRYGIGNNVSGSIKIEVYSMDGVLVAELENEIAPGQENQIEWITTGIASGIYYGRVYIDDKESESKYIKIAIVK
ncbi:MAG: T9SS type A sorting domain-containing protein [Candidatus Zixiibacteriota bacterium]